MFLRTSDDVFPYPRLKTTAVYREERKLSPRLADLGPKIRNVECRSADGSTEMFGWKFPQIINYTPLALWSVGYRMEAII
jgi:hypothetical protein